MATTGRPRALTPKQEAFLEERPHAIVATLMPDGRPQLTPAWYLWDGERFWVSTLDWTVKVKNAKRDPRVTLCIDGPSRRTNYAQVFGTAEVVEGDVRERTLDLIRKYEPVEADAVAHWESIKNDRVLLVVTPERFQWRYDD
jgi:PPOX class probable F420-dependent enzyme